MHPTIATFTIVLARGGISALAAFLSRLPLRRSPPGRVAFLLPGIPLIFTTGSLITGYLSVDPFAFDGFGPLAAAMLLMLFLGPIEEFGWRGLALLLLQRPLASIGAGIVVGLSWGLWHLPAFYLPGTVQSARNFTPFFVGSVCLCVIVVVPTRRPLSGAQ